MYDRSDLDVDFPYTAIYRALGVTVPFWLWRWVPGRFKSMELTNA